ncbi:helix-turn-helix domain-containing protein [Candidatus Alkanophaga liquidiphilum]
MLALVLRLHEEERAALGAALPLLDDAEKRRALALLMLDAGGSVVVVARKLGVSRQAVYNWVRRLEDARRQRDVLRSVLNAKPPGRPPVKAVRVVEFLRRLERVPPAALGYESAEWTTPALLDFLRKNGVKVSVSTLRRCLRATDFKLALHRRRTGRR